ncbi:MAG: lipopolysaccharide biosynthesis protein [Thiolinea sp.]
MAQNQLIKGSLYLLAQLIPAVAAIFTLAIYTRWLTAEEFGTYSTLLVVATAVNLMLFNWLYVGVYRFWNDGQLSGQDLQLVMIVSLCGASILVLALCTMLAIWTQQYLLLAAFALLLICGAFFSAYQRVNAIKQQAGRFLWTETLKVLIASLTGVFLVWQGFSWPGIIAGLCIGFISVLLFSRHFRQLFFVWPKINDADLFRRLLVYGLPLSITFVLLEIIHASDRILLSWLLSIEAAGQYAAAISLPNQLLLMLGNAVGMALYPRIIRLFEHSGEERAAEELSNYFLILFGILLPAWFGLIAVRHDFIPLILGEEYVASALMLLPWLGAAIVMNCLYLFYVSYAFQLSHQTAATIRVVLGATLLNILLNSLLIPLSGVFGAALATIAAYAVCVVYGFWEGNRHFPLTIEYSALLKIVLSAALMLIILEILPLHYGWFPGLLRVFIGIIVYTLLILLMDIAGIRSVVLRHMRGLTTGLR